MTKEEAIKELLVTYLGDSERIIQAKKMAIKSLEQEPILAKIRAEIMAIGNWTTKGELPNGYLIKVIEIIDKYKAESEEV